MASRALTTLVVVAAFGPWATLLPLPGALAVLVQALAFVAAIHGAGMIASRFATSAAVTLQYGMALLVGIGGIVQLFGLATLGGQLVILYILIAVHGATLVVRRRSYVAALGRAFEREPWWLAPALLLVALGTFHVLGAAGAIGARPFDDDGHVLAQIQRLRVTGSLDDAVGYARVSQLGGQLSLSAFATAGGNVSAVRMLEALALVLALVLAVSRMHVASARGALWGSLVVVAASALAFVPSDPVACWTIVGLVIALYQQLDGDRDALLVGLLAGALVALRLELVPLALVAIAVTPARSRKQLLVAAGGALAIVLPYLIARTIARGAVSADVLAQLAPAKPLLGRLAIFAGIALLAIPVALVARHVRWLAVACVLVLAAIVGELFGARSYGLRMVWPLALACVLCAATALARRQVATAAVLLVSLAIAMLVYDGRAATGRAKWARRYLDFAANIEYLRHASRHPPLARHYAALLANVEPGAMVAIWVASPELVTYDGAARVVDLRTPRLAKLLRTQRWTGENRAERLLSSLGARYVLFELDDRTFVRAASDPAYRFACSMFELERCADDLERVVANGTVVAQGPGAVLVKL